jgi:hypothetical protein
MLDTVSDRAVPVGASLELEKALPDLRSVSGKK